MDGHTLDQARSILWDTLSPGDPERVPLEQAVGRVVARDLATDVDFPPFPRITMDGYAVRAADTLDARPQHPVRLRVVGTAAAGAPLAGSVGGGEAAQALTGAPLPEGADAVVRVEDTAGFDDQHAQIHVPVTPGSNVAPRGEDLRAGEVVVPAGTRLASHHLQALASAGWAQVPVIAAPRAAVLTTGDELVPIAQRPGPGQIRESNNVSARSVLAEFGIPAHDLGVVRDDPPALRAALARALADHALVIVSGGISMGTRDFVKEALAACGVQLRFAGLHLRPGHPSAFGVHGGGCVFALPGNPVAVFATLVAVYAAGLRRLVGLPTPMPPRAWATLARDVHRRGQRPLLLPVRLDAPASPGAPVADPLPMHGSGDFVALARGDALALLPDDRSWFRAGDPVEILRLPPRGGA